MFHFFFQPLPLISRCIAKVVSVIPCAPISSCSRSSGQSSACHKCSRAKRILFRIMSCNATNLTRSCARFAKSTHTQARRARYIEGSETAKLSRALSDDSTEGEGGRHAVVRLCAINIMHNNYFIVKLRFHDLVSWLSCVSTLQFASLHTIERRTAAKTESTTFFYYIQTEKLSKVEQSLRNVLTPMCIIHN